MKESLDGDTVHDSTCSPDIQQRPRRRHDTATADDVLLDTTTHTLFLDVFVLWSDSGREDTEQNRQQFLALAALAVALNAHFAPVNESYPWMSGGNGLVFGVHGTTTERHEAAHHKHTKAQPDVVIPHLRAICRYSVSVADEWQAIHMLLSFDWQAFVATTRPVWHTCSLLTHCWDVEDGQVLLIQAADHLPAWIDDIGPEQCRYRCWIYHASPVQGCTHQDLDPTLTATGRTTSGNETTGCGRIYLLQPAVTDHPVPTLSLGDALAVWHQNHVTSTATTTRIVPAPVAVYPAMPSPSWHVTAVAVPRRVAHLWHHRPDLIPTACRMFAHVATHPVSNDTLDDTASYLAGHAHDWVWTTIRTSRTAYAMLRSICASPHWLHEDSIHPPSVASNIQVRQLCRTCAVESTPHLRYGVALGVRLVAGLDACLQSSHATNPTRDGPSVTERRVAYWSHLWHQTAAHQGCGGDDWIRDAWRAGPNEARYQIDPLRHCPVWDPDLTRSLTPLSHPETSVADQIRRELCRTTVSDTTWTLCPPHASDVDDDAWLWQSPWENDTADDPSDGTPAPTRATTDTTSIDMLLQGVQSFMAGQSSVDGVETATFDDSRQVDSTIDPTVFLNMLHATLQAPSVEALAALLEANEDVASDPNDPADPFFSEDYDLMMPLPDDNGVDDIQAAMNAMDAELRESSTALSREWDHAGSTGVAVGRTGVVEPRGATPLNVHVVSHLLQSLSESQGGPGPIHNMLMDLQIPTPDVLAEAEDDREDT